MISRRWYIVHWRSHGIYPTRHRILASDAREAARWGSRQHIFVHAIEVEASGELVDPELWR